MKMKSLRQKRSVKKAIQHILTAGVLFSPLTAFAKSTKNNALVDVIHGLTDFITDDVGTALCTLAIIGTGFLWLKAGRIEKEHAIGTMLGIGLIYSASFIVKNVLLIS